MKITGILILCKHCSRSAIGVVSVKNGMLSLEDLCQEGRIAIMLAYNTYDIRKEAQSFQYSNK